MINSSASLSPSDYGFNLLSKCLACFHGIYKLKFHIELSIKAFEDTPNAAGTKNYVLTDNKLKLAAHFNRDSFKEIVDISIYNH